MIPIIITVVILKFCPDVIPIHYDLYGNIINYGSKYTIVIVLVMIIPCLK